MDHAGRRGHGSMTDIPAGLDESGTFTPAPLRTPAPTIADIRASVLTLAITLTV